MGNRNGTARKSDEKSSDVVPVAGSSDGVITETKKRRRREGKGKKIAPSEAANKATDTAAADTTKTSKPADLIDEKTRHQDHLLPELITTTVLTTKDENTENKDGEKDDGKTADDDVSENADKQKQLTLTIYRSYSNPADESTASGNGSDGVVVQKPGVRLDDVKLYRRSKLVTESEIEEVAEKPEGASNSDVAESDLPPPDQPPEEVVVTQTSTPSANEVSTSSRKKPKKKGSERRRSNSPSESTANSNDVTDVAKLRVSMAAVSRDYPELIGRRAVKMRCDSSSETRSRSSTVTSSPAMTSVIAKYIPVSKSDFPDTSAIRTRLRQFEGHFVNSFVTKFTAYPIETQLSRISLAVRNVTSEQLESDPVKAVVSMDEYLKASAAVTAQIQSRRDYVITVPETVFREATTVRSRLAADSNVSVNLQTAVTVARDATRSAASLGIDEISRMFEYQIVLIGSTEQPIKMLAEHASDCVIDYVMRDANTQHCLDRNTIIKGVLLGNPTIAADQKKFLSVVIGQRELKWSLEDVFKRPGLRREMLLFPLNEQPDYSMEQALKETANGDQSVSEISRGPPWTFHTRSFQAVKEATSQGVSRFPADHLLYGYRSLAVLWDFSRPGGGYTVDETLSPPGGEELNYFDETVEPRYDDFHRLYCPFRRLVGADVMKLHLQHVVRNSSTEDSEPISFAELVYKLNGTGYRRDEIQPVYRPLVSENQSDSTSRCAQYTASVDALGLCVIADPDASETAVSDKQEQPIEKNEEELIQKQEAPDNKLLLAPPPAADDKDKHSTVSSMSGSNSGLTSSKLMALIAESGDNVRRLMKDVREHVKLPRKGRSKKHNDVGKDAAAVTSDKAKTTVTFETPEQQEPQVKTETAAVEENVVQIHASKSDVLESEPAVTVSGLAGHRLTAQPPGNTRGLRWKLPTSNRERVLQALNSLKAVEITSNVKLSATPSTPIAGRSLEVEYLFKLLSKDDRSLPAEDREEPHPRLIVLTGCHGIGKSAVANAVGYRLTISSAAAADVAHQDQAHLGCRLTGDGGVEESDADKPSIPAFYAVVTVDLRGCDGTQESLFARIFGAFGFPFRMRYENGQPDWFCRWLSFNCSRQGALLLILDNLDFAPDRNDTVSQAINYLLKNVAELTLLVTSRHMFYRSAHCSTDSVNASINFQELSIKELGRSDLLFLQMVPDLSDDDIRHLGALCQHIPYAVKLLAGLLQPLSSDARGLVDAVQPTVDVETLLELVSAAGTRPSLSKIEAEIRDTMQPKDENEARQLRAIATAALVVLDSCHTAFADILRSAAVHNGPFRWSTDDVAANLSDRHLAPDILRNMLRLGLLTTYEDVAAQTDVNAAYYVIPPVVRIAVSHLATKAEVGRRQTLSYLKCQVKRLSSLCRQFHSVQTESVLNLLTRPAERDQLVDAIQRLTDCLLWKTDADITEYLDEIKKSEDLWSIASIEGAAFLDEFLPGDIYRAFFEALESVASRNSNEATLKCDEKCASLMKLRQCDTLCCRAYQEVARSRCNMAAVFITAAYELLSPTRNEDVDGGGITAVYQRQSGRSDTDLMTPERAFCSYCLARIYVLSPVAATLSLRTVVLDDVNALCGGRKEHLAVAAQLARRSLDCYRAAYVSSQTRNAAAAGTGVLYASELLAKTLSAQFGHTQSALYVCQYSDGGYNTQPSGSSGRSSGSSSEAPAMTLMTLSDLGACHPLVIEAHDLRRKLWMEVGLVQRTRFAAVASSQSTRLYYTRGPQCTEHPGACQSMFNLSEALAMSGSVDEAICIGVECLATRIKTLGDHIDTAQSYRTLSQLLLRRRLADASALFANAAVFTLSRIGAPTREAELDLAKARQRQLGNDRKPAEDKPNSDETEPETATAVPVPGESCRQSVDKFNQLELDRIPLIVSC